MAALEPAGLDSRIRAQALEGAWAIFSSHADDVSPGSRDRDLAVAALDAIRTAVAISPEGDHRLGKRRERLAALLRELYRETREVEYLRELLDGERLVTDQFRDLARPESLDHLDRLAAYGIGLFEHTQDSSLLAPSYEAARTSLSNTLPGHPEYAHRQRAAMALLEELVQTPERAAYLPDAIALWQPMAASNDLVPEERLLRSHQLGSLLAKNYEETEDLDQLSRAIDTFRKVMDDASRENELSAIGLDSLRKALVKRFDAAGDVQDLKDAISATQLRLDVVTTDDGRAHAYAALAQLWSKASKVDPSKEVLLNCVDAARSSIELAADDAPYLVEMLALLASSLQGLARFGMFKQVATEAVTTARRVVVLTSETDRGYVEAINLLASTLLNEYDSTGDRQALVEAESLARRATESSRANDPGYASALSTHAEALRTLGMASGSLDKLDRAADVARVRVRICAESGELSDERHARSQLAIILGASYRASGDRRYLEEGVASAREATEITIDNSIGAAAAINNHATMLSLMYEATQNRDVLAEATAEARRAVDLTPAGTDDLLIHQTGLANRLLAHGTADALNEAITITRQVVASTSASNHRYATRLSNLGAMLATSDDPGSSAEAVEVLRKSVGVSRDLAEQRAGLNNLAQALANEFERTGDQAHIDEALAFMKAGKAKEPSRERALYSQTRARLHRLDGDLRSSIEDLEAASEARAVEVHRLRNSPLELRDLAGETEGILSDLAQTYAALDEPAEVIRVLEADRTWLKAPERDVGLRDQPPAVWVVAGRDETAVVTVDGVRLVPGLGRKLLLRRVRGLLAAVTFEEMALAVEGLCEFANGVAEHLPAADELIVVPVGLWAMVPFSAAQLSDGPLIEKTALTIAPTLRWATSASRGRPVGGSVGSFWPGQPPLDLAADRDVFRRWFPDASVATVPRAEWVLGNLDRSTALAHFSCHGRYDMAAPMQSSLILEDELTVAEILEHGQSSWLVNLSACETGIPDIMRSEQMISFPTAFLMGGAAHVMATIWPVANETATQYNNQLYRALDNGATPATAHKEAVNELRRDTTEFQAQTEAGFIRADHPLFWAGFNHYGSPA